MRMILITVVLALIALGVAHFVRKSVRRTREELKDVDRSKLRDLDADEWDDSWDDDWNGNGKQDKEQR